MKETETEQLYRQHYQQMIGLARAMLYDEEEARDVVSEVFASLVQTDVTPRNAENYLMTSVRNRCLNLIEHKNVRTKFEQAYAIEIKHHDNYEDLTATTVDQQYQQLMAYARHRMTEQTLRVFQMRHLQGMKYQEIADRLGISRVMVYKHLVKAMTSMKEYKLSITLLGILFVSVMALAAIQIVRHQRAGNGQPEAGQVDDNQQAASATKDSISADATTPSIIRYNEATLQKILTDMADYYHLHIEWKDEEAKTIRMFFQWDQHLEPAEAIGQLNMFERIHLKLSDNTIIAE